MVETAYFNHPIDDLSNKKPPLQAALMAYQITTSISNPPEV
jgi:hypothetical protein